MKPKNKHLNLLIIGLLFVMGIVFSPMTAQAEEITDSVNGVISFEEYYTTLRSEYKKRGVDFTIINPDTTKTYTEKQLEKEISQICEEPVREATAQNNAAELLKSLSPQSVARTPMPINKTYSTDKIVSPNNKPSCYATIRMEASAVIDLQYNQIMSVSGCTTYRTGGLSNFYSWKQNSARAWSEGTKTIAATANGQVVFHEQAGGGQVNVYEVNVNFGTMHWTA